MEYTKENLIEAIQSYTPYNEQEEQDKQVILHFLRTNEDAFDRTNLIAHMTASAWVVNKERSKVLMVYHNIYHSWAWLGGHADGEMNLLNTALREVREESGIAEVRAVSEDIFSLEILTVDGHEKKGQYVPGHLHFNITYLLEADDHQILHIKEDENSGVAWFAPQQALEKSTEPWFVSRIYIKLIEKQHSLGI